MSTTLNTVGAFVLGAMVMTPLMGGVSRLGSGTALYIAAPVAAGEILHRLGKYPEEGTADTAWRALAAEEFAEDLDRMEWTWNRQIRWKSEPPHQP